MGSKVVPFALAAGAITLGVATGGIGGFAGLGVAAGLSATTASTIGTGLIGLGASSALSGVAGLFAADASASVDGRAVKRSVRSSDLYERIVYGRVRTGGQLVYWQSHNEDKRLLTMIIIVAAHEVDALEYIYVDGKRVDLQPNDSGHYEPADLIPVWGSGYRGEGKPFISLRFYDGTQTAADSFAVASLKGRWTTSHVLRGYAYCRITLRYHDNKFPSGVPEINFVLRGKKLLDPRTGLTRWSDNPALIAADYLTSEWGWRASWSRINSTSLIAAANVCEEPVLQWDGETTADRYTCNMVVESRSAPAEVLGHIEASMAGKIVRLGGEISIYAGAAGAIAGSIGTDDFLDAVSVEVSRPLGELANTVKATYFDAGVDWNEEETIPITIQGYVDEDGGEVLPLDLDLQAVDNNSQAQRLAKIALMTNRMQLHAEVSCKLNPALLFNVWDVIEVTHAPFGWNAKKFRVVDWGFTPWGDEQVGVKLRLQEYADEIYDWSFGEEDFYDPAPDYEFFDPLEALPEVAGLTAAVRHQVDAFGVSRPSLEVSWTQLAEDDDTAEEIDIGWRSIERAFPDASAAPLIFSTGHGFARVSDWADVTKPATGGVFLTPTLEPFTLYEVRARYRNGEFVGAWSSVQVWVLGVGVAPTPPWGLTAAPIDLETVEARWHRDNSSDLRETRIYHSLTGGTLADRASATLLTASRERTARVGGLAVGWRAWLWARNVATDGTESAWSDEAGVEVEIPKKLGDLADKDRVDTGDIEPEALSQGFAASDATTVSLTSSYKTLVTLTVDIGPDPARALVLIRAIPSGGTTNDSVDYRLRLNNENVDVTTPKLDVGAWADYFDVPMPAGESIFHLQGRIASGTGLQSRANKIVVLALKR